MNNNYNQQPMPNQTMGYQQPMMNPGQYGKSKISPIVGYISAAVMAISIFLPYYKYSSYGFETTYNYFKSGEGAFFLAFAIISVILIFAKKHMTVVFAGITGIIFAIRDIIMIGDLEGADIGFGVWCALIGSIALLVSAFLYWKENPECLKGIIEIKPKNQYGYMQQPMQNQMMNPGMNYNQPQQPVVNNNNSNQV